MSAAVISPTVNRRLAAFGLCAALASSFGQTFFIGLFGAELRAAHGLGEDAFGLLYGLATLGSGLLMFWLGGIADRYYMRNAVSAVLMVLAAGCVLMAATRGIAGLLAALFLLRLGGQGLLGHLAVVAAARGTAERRGRTVAWAAMGFILGEAMFPLAATGVMYLADWRIAWWLAAVFAVLVALPGLRRLAGDARPPSDDDGPSLAAWRRRDLLRRPVFLAALTILLVPAFVVTAVFFHQSSLAALRGWSGWHVAAAFIVFAAFQLSATIAAGRLVDRFGSPAVMRFLLAPLGLGLLALGFGAGLPSLYLLFAGLGATAGANAVVAGAVWAEIYGTRRLGMVRGVYMALMVLSSAASPPLLGAALASGVSLTALCGAGAAYALVLPLWTGGLIVRAERLTGGDGVR